MHHAVVEPQDNFDEVYDWLAKSFLIEGCHEKVDTGHWQALKNVPHTKTREIQHVLIHIPIQPTSGSWAAKIKPNLSWAEDHFLERVSGEPLNPGEEYKNWPWFDPNWKAQGENKRFSHTYMERFWPRHARDFSDIPSDLRTERLGIRYRYGDLNDLIELLRREPHTRQAYLPIWFPEDLSATLQEERVPCTLGYHFMLRDDRLHVFYPMRSVDLIRYLRDDIYMAGRLCQWIIDRLRWKDFDNEDTQLWDYIVPGNLTFFASSLHIFEGDVPKLEREYGQQTV